MDSSVRYQMVPQEDYPTPPGNPPPQGIPPPAYEVVEGAEAAASPDLTIVNEAGATPTASSSSEIAGNEEQYKCQGSFPLPPPYSVATAELPTYEEAQQAKIVEDEEERQPPHDVTSLFSHEHDILGTDFLFFISFFVAFLFSWVGFLLLLCFCQTLAGRYGALAGFGLSLAKWTLIVKHSTDLVSPENEWLWWIIMAFGILICARATLQYIHAKREWRLLNPMNRERIFFFY